MLTLRPYQQEALQAIADAQARGVQRQVVSLPTGAGKTICFAHLVAAYAQRGRVIILCHRDELLAQTQAKLLDLMPTAQMGLVKAEQNDTASPIVLASVQTLSRDSRLRQLATDWALIICDECHHCAGGLTPGAERNSWTRALLHLGGYTTRAGRYPLIVGFTATPFYPDGTPLVAPDDSSFFQEIVYYKHLLEMIEAGYLVAPRALRLTLQDFSLKGLKKIGGDYSSAAIEERMLSVQAPKHLAASLREHAADRRTIAFSPGIQMAHELTEAVRLEGMAAATITGSTSTEERARAYQAMRDGNLQVLSSVMVLTEGFDLPAVDTVLLARATTSKVLYQQAIGRGLRLSPETGKTECLILDATGATERNNLYSMAEMLGLVKPKEAEEERRAAGGVAQREEDEEEDQQLDLSLGKELLAYQSKLLRQSAYMWVKTIRGAFVLSLPDNVLIRIKIAADAPDRGTLELKRQRTVTVLAKNIPTAHAFGIGEDTARSMGYQRFSSKSAPWAKAPGSDAQKAFAKKLGIDIAQYPTKGQLSDAITRITGDW